MKNQKSQRGGGGHSGPGGRRINFWKCTKKEAKRGNNTLNINFPKTGLFFDERFKKMIFGQFCILALKRSLWAIGTEKQAAEQPNGHLLENRRYPELPQDMWEICSCWVEPPEPRWRWLYACSVKRSRILGQKWALATSQEPPLQRCQQKKVELWVYHHDDNNLLDVASKILILI